MGFQIGRASILGALRWVESQDRPALRLAWTSSSSVLARHSAALYRLDGICGYNGGLFTCYFVRHIIFNSFPLLLLITPVPPGRNVSCLVIIQRNIYDRSCSGSHRRRLFSYLMIINQLNPKDHQSGSLTLELNVKFFKTRKCILSW